MQQSHSHWPEIGPWATYVPNETAPWNLRRVVHLHRRAGFAATWTEIQRDLAEGPDPSVDRLIQGKARLDCVPNEFDRIAALLADTAVSSRDPSRLKAWWIYRILFSPDPLGERLTLMWHNHFATSNQKVNDLEAMRRQNEIFRELARAPFGELLSRAVRDRGLLIWLDAQANRKEHPNENLARELMEVFTLGVGHYSETDVKEAARALTGWSVTSNGAFREIAERHDGGVKTILGRSGPWRGDDLVRMLLEEPATSERLAFRIIEMLLPEQAMQAAPVQALAARLREHNLDVGWAVETVLRSEAFFSEVNLSKRIISPIEYVVGVARALERFDPPPSTLVLAEWSARLGQDPFYPPNVFGWPGGRAWITTRSVIGRNKYAAALVAGLVTGKPAPLDAIELAQRHNHGSDLESMISFYCKLVYGTEPTAAARDRLMSTLGDSPAAEQATVRRAVVQVVSSPEAQLG